MNYFYMFFLGILVGAIFADIKKRFGVDLFWIGVVFVTLLSLLAMVFYKDIL